ncbi:MAG: ankyrin repeat domain-containing protein [Alphaproteobacteria bacterium]|nr:ankyrin repeat domain-containing protein [Alphaproteobacteria bacterium]
MKRFLLPFVFGLCFAVVAQAQSVESSEAEESSTISLGGYNIDKNAQLFDALFQGANIDVINALCQRNENIIQKDEEGKTPLQVAIRIGSDIKILKALILNGIDVNSVDNNFNTALMDAAQIKGKAPVIELLLNSKANVFMLNKDGKSALDLAIDNSNARPLIAAWIDGYLFSDKTSSLRKDVMNQHNSKALRRLLNKSIEYVTPENTPTLVMQAVNDNKPPKFIKDLNDFEGKINATVSGYSALHIAKMDENIDVIELLLKEGAYFSYDEASDFLFLPIQDPYVSKLLLENLAKVYAKDEDGFTPIFVAIRKGSSVPVIESLIKAGADVNEIYVSKDKKTKISLLQYAYMYAENPYVIELLENNGAKLFPKEKKNKIPPLFFAVKNRFVEPVLWLIKDRNADVQKSFNGTNSILLASENIEQPGVLHAVIEAGADPNVHEGKTYKTPLQKAVKYGNAGYLNAAFLIGSNSNVDDVDVLGRTALMETITESFENEQVVDLLIDKKANVNIKDKNGDSAIMLAAANCSKPDVIYSLFNAGANPNDLDAKGRSVLGRLVQEGAKNSCYATAEALIKVGADVDFKNKEKRTVLMQAAKYTNCPEIVELLIKAGAKVFEKDIDGMNALEYGFKNLKLRKSSVYDKLRNSIEDGDKYVFDYSLPKKKELTLKEIIANGNDLSLFEKRIKEIMKKSEDGNKKALNKILYNAVANTKNTDFINLLILNGADVNYKNENDKSVLMNAAEFGTPNIVKLLINYNADKTVVSSENKIAYNYALYNENVKYSSAYYLLRP